MGEKVQAADKTKPDLYAPMDHGSHGVAYASHEGYSGHTGHGDHGVHSSHGAHTGHGGHTVKGESPKEVIDTLTVDKLKAKESTVLPRDAKVTDLKFVLGGDMERYVWHINGKAIHEDKNLLTNEGDVVRFTFVNETMMHHPMHLHGHFFRVINENGDCAGGEVCQLQTKSRDGPLGASRSPWT